MLIQKTKKKQENYNLIFYPSKLLNSTIFLAYILTKLQIHIRKHPDNKNRQFEKFIKKNQM